MTEISQHLEGVFNLILFSVVKTGSALDNTANYFIQLRRTIAVKFLMSNPIATNFIFTSINCHYMMQTPINDMVLFRN